MKTEIEKYHACNEAVEFRKKFKTFEGAWSKCSRGDWMLWIAQKVGVDLQRLTLAKALCAKTVLHLMTDERSKKAVEIAEKFGRGKATKEELDAAADAAYYAYVAANAAAPYANYHAAASAYAADAAYYVHAAYADDDAAYGAAAYGAAYAAYAAYDAAYADDAHTENQLATAKICRRILTKEVLKLIK